MQSFVQSVLPLLLALVAVGAVLYLSYLFSRYLAVGASRINKSKYIRIIDRVVLGQDRMIAIAAIGEKHYLLSSTSQSIQILTEISADDLMEAGVEMNKLQEGQNFRGTLKAILSRKDHRDE